MLKTTKKYIEDLFIQNWIATPIHFAGQEFNAEGITEWINPTVNPLRNRASGLGNSMQYDFIVSVVCWSPNEVDSFTLADAVATFMHTQIDMRKYINIGYEVLDNGWQDSNTHYTLLSFEFKTYGGVCLPLCSQSIGGEDGTEFNLDGIWQPNCVMFSAVTCTDSVGGIDGTEFLIDGEWKPKCMVFKSK